MADPNFEGRSVAVGDPLEGRLSCACADPVLPRSSGQCGAPWAYARGRPYIWFRPTIDRRLYPEAFQLLDTQDFPSLPCLHFSRYHLAESILVSASIFF